MLAACDASKDALETTKTTLASVQKERDELKTQVFTLQQQLDAAKSELAKATPAANKTPADAKAGTAAAPAEKAKKAHKS
jgi:hypothetical protein